jgi:protein BCP1
MFVFTLNDVAKPFQDKPFIHTLTQYLQSKSSSGSSLSQLPTLLSPSTGSQVGLILTERLINMPAEIVPPMYTMLLEEIGWALEEKEPYTFSHYLILSKTYKEVTSKLDQEESRPAKKKKKDAADPENTFYFHPEDEILHKHALGYCNFDYTHQGDEGAADSKRTFNELGVVPQGHMILVESGKFAEAVTAIAEFLKQQ